MKQGSVRQKIRGKCRNNTQTLKVHVCKGTPHVYQAGKTYRVQPTRHPVRKAAL
jgi:hypothetical protein